VRQTISFLLVSLLIARLSPAALGAEDVAGQIIGMTVGTNIEVRLKDKQTLRGARGEVSGSGFTLVNPGGGDRKIAFDDVSSVKQWNKKSHTVRNILIGVGIGLAVVVVVFTVYVKTHPI
jgi:hypothetical protein